MQLKYIILHHTATSPLKTVAAIRAEHKAKGWRDIGYNYLVDHVGAVHTGRPLTIPGAHTLGYNNKSIGVAAIGNFQTENMPTAQKNSIVKIVAKLSKQYNIPKQNILRHCDVAATACPGSNFPWADIKNMKEDGNVSMFKDLDKCWYPSLAEEAVKRGIIAAPTDGYLRPRDNISREEVWLIQLRANAMKDFDALVPALTNRCLQSVVRIWKNGSIGSGSFIGKNIILTNHHVVKGATAVNIDTFDSGDNQLKGKVIKTDEAIDLALVELPGKGYPALKLADKIVHGEPVLVLGNPLGEWQSVSAGIVTRSGGDYVQTDALINPGNSGGALVNAEGELIGVPTWKINQTAVDNHNYSVILGKIKKFVEGVV